MSYRVRFTKPNGETGYWERTFATRAGATTTADHARDSTGYAHTVEEMADAPTAAVPDATFGSTTERLVAMLRERHAQGLAKYGVALVDGNWRWTLREGVA